MNGSYNTKLLVITLLKNFLINHQLSQIFWYHHIYLLPPEISVDIEVTKEKVVLCLPSYPLDDHEFKESCFRMKKSLNGRTLCQNLHKTIDTNTYPVTWGTEHEPVAIKKYISYKNFTISVKKCGFIIHPEKGWLGASTCKGISVECILPIEYQNHDPPLCNQISLASKI